MNSFIMMKTIEVCKGFIILNTFIMFLSNTWCFMEMKTTVLCKVLTTSKELMVFLSYHVHCYEKIIMNKAIPIKQPCNWGWLTVSEVYSIFFIAGRMAGMQHS